jgi:hypothetical protein
MARSRRPQLTPQCRLPGVNRTRLALSSTAARDPKETFRWSRNSRLRAILGCLRVFHSLVEGATIGEVRVSPHVARHAKAGRKLVVPLQ